MRCKSQRLWWRCWWWWWWSNFLMGRLWSLQAAQRHKTWLRFQTFPNSNIGTGILANWYLIILSSYDCHIIVFSSSYRHHVITPTIIKLKLWNWHTPKLVSRCRHIIQYHLFLPAESLALTSSFAPYQNVILKKWVNLCHFLRHSPCLACFQLLSFGSCSTE